jgi:8-oxo-dGTP pyrophosphatase MutT (NUDIX family)
MLEAQEVSPMARARIPSSFFVFVVVEHAGQVLLVREAKHGQRWYAPAGGMEVGETIRDAAIRETQEEAGVLVEPTALLRIEQQWYPSERGEGLVSWWRYVVRAHPVGSLTPKRHPDHHSLEARWVRPEAIGALSLRHPEVTELVALALANPPSMPLVA